MMNKLSIIAVIAMSMIGIAYADKDSSPDLLLKKWTGFYAGVNAGLVFNYVQLKSQHLGFTSPTANCNTCSAFSTFLSGIQVGYTHQVPNDLVSGIEANVSLNTNQKDNLSCNSLYNANVYDRFSFTNQTQSSIKGRLGRAFNWNKNILLPYLTAGPSFANVGLTYKNEGGDYYSKKTIQTGLLVGVGIEWAFRQHWSLRAEYYNVNYGDTIKLQIPSVYGLVDANGDARVSLSSNNVMVAISYWI